MLFLIHIQPTPIKAGLGQLIGLFWFDVLRIRRNTAISNIQKAFPQMNKKEAVKMARTSLIHMGYTIVEFVSFPFFNKEDIDQCFEFEGDSLQILRDGLSHNKGVFMLSAHIGNGDLAVAALCYNQLPIHLVSKIFKTKWLNDFWFEARRKHGAQFISPRRSSYDILKALKKNDIVIFVLDQYTGPPNGILTTFFGHPTGTAWGPALLAQRSKSVVIPAYSYRKKFGQYVIKASAPIEFEEKETKEETLLYNTQKYNAAIEQMVLDHPEQWMWIHKRWKVGWALD